MSEVVIRREGRAGRITLNRPEALNALTHRMVRDIRGALAAWRAEDGVAAVLIDSAGERAFCAGGDVATLHALMAAGRLSEARAFFADEYRMNAAIGGYPKPVVTLLRGFVMGGGVGVGCHAALRIVGESARLAMPECALGLMPDVGGTLLLARAPGRLGRYLGMTGARMGPDDAVFAGFADHFVPEARWPDLIAAVIAGDAPRAVAMAQEPGAGAMRGARDWIDRCFGAPSVGAMLALLDAEGTETATRAAASLRAASPLALATTLECLDRARECDGLREALAREYRFAWRALAAGEFAEGIRARIVDRDNNPRWRHGAPDGVPAAEVAAMLAPLGADELQFGEDGT